jgi:hypothetical protein
MTLRIVLALVGGAFAFSANMIAFQIIDQINEKVPEAERVGWLGWSSGIKKQHRRLYPESRLVLAMNVCATFMVLTFVLLMCLTLSF